MVLAEIKDATAVEGGKVVFYELYRNIFPAKMVTTEVVANIFDNEPATVWLLPDTKGRWLGFLYFWTVADELQIIDFGVDLNHRREGYGSRLFGHLIDLARETHRDIVLEVRADNPGAISFYENWGLFCEGKRKAYYEDGTDGYLYRWKA